LAVGGAHNIFLGDLVRTAGTAALLSFVLTIMIRRLALRVGAVDVPNERSSHAAPTPRGGGIAILFGFCVPLIVFGSAGDRGVLYAIVATAMIAALGLADDVKHLSVLPRFIVQTLIATSFVIISDLALRRIDFPFISIPLDGLAVAFTVVFVVGWVNAYNFMDGVNGIAAVQAIVAGIALTVLLGRSGDTPGAITAAALVGGCAGFLPWNFPVARIFMGDVGSGAIGFLFGFLILRASPRVGIVAATLPLFPFLFDSAVTMLRRAAKGEKFFLPHRKHFYQQLAQVSGSHVVSTSVWGLLAVISSIAALVYSGLSNAGAALLLVSVLLIHAVVAWTISWRLGRSREGGARLPRVPESDSAEP